LVGLYYIKSWGILFMLVMTLKVFITIMVVE
jgi:hypothetical protein